MSWHERSFPNSECITYFRTGRNSYSARLFHSKCRKIGELLWINPILFNYCDIFWQFYEVLKVVSSLATLSIPLTGKGVSPVISISVQDGVLDMGDVLQGESASSTFSVRQSVWLCSICNKRRLVNWEIWHSFILLQISNSSSLKVDYCIRLDSNSLLKHSLSQQLPITPSEMNKKRMHDRMLAGMFETGWANLYVEGDNTSTGTVFLKDNALVGNLSYWSLTYAMISLTLSASKHKK